MDKEKRRGEKPIPDNLSDYLNDDQLAALKKMEDFGWRLEFVRRPAFEKPLAVVMSGAGDKIGVLEEDGRVNMEAEVILRK